MTAAPIIAAGRPMVSHAHRWDRIGTRRPDDIRPLAPGDRYTGACPKANSGAYAWRRSDGTCVCCGKYVPQDGPHGEVTGIVDRIEPLGGEPWWAGKFAIHPLGVWEDRCH